MKELQPRKAVFITLKNMIMYYDRIDFNAEYIASLTLEDFTEQNKANYFLNQPEGVRIAKLKEVYDECCLQVKGVGEPQPATIDVTPVPESKKVAKDKSANDNANNGEPK